MARVTKSLTAKRKHKKVLDNAKGYYGARSRLYKTAKQSNIKALQYAFRDRKNKKRNFRSLWISRINAALNESGISYSNFINALSKKNIALNRKILADMAVSDNTTFKKVVEIAKD
ncbi:MAG: 50S ribosomal protein L20 [Flavobacteriaceae bacterium]|nr:50S ribosomal protein L20 [Flavobacteriaceae bacterium]MDC3103093.1 50S ribosomal protein L20 [Gammaproteobacteria bacterium]|tara:strand:+ start:1774 stop:2121 length:348 start_codon:yes stop_codon:yes gene_type:complete